MSEPLTDAIKRYAASPKNSSYEGKTMDAYRIADAACRLLPELVAALQQCYSLMGTGDEPTKTIAMTEAALAHARELGVTT